MTIFQIKEKLGISSLDFAQCFDKQDNPTEWLRHWENSDRISVVIKQETADLIKAKLNRDDLSLWTERAISEDKQVLNEDTNEMELKPGQEYLNCVIHLMDNHVISF